MSQVTLKINGQQHSLDIPSDMTLLWVLRDLLNLVGTKYGCGVGLCGTCTVLIDGEPAQSCLLPANGLADADIVTIEGFAPAGDHPVQRAWNDEDVAQCGYCQGGQILATAALLNRNPDPSDQEIEQAMSSNLCRCGTYPRIRKAIRLAARYVAGEDGATS